MIVDSYTRHAFSFRVKYLIFNFYMSILGFKVNSWIRLVLKDLILICQFQLCVNFILITENSLIPTKFTIKIKNNI